MSFSRKYLFLMGALFALLLTFRYAFPVLLPFLLGFALALTAEPVVRFSCKRLHLPRWAGAGLGICVTLITLIALLWLAGSFLVKEVATLAKALPDLRNTAQQGLELLQTKAMALSQKMPAGLGHFLSGSVTALSADGSALLEQTALRLPAFLSSAMGKVSHGFICIGTGLVSAFLISARLPILRVTLRQKVPQQWQDALIPAFHRIRTTLGGWLKAQGILMLITYGIVCAGFLLLQIPYGPAWAILIALVDAVPMLGTGTVLLPWALIRLLQGHGLQALGLALIFAVTALLRSVLEPKLVGRHIGLDPLVTLLAMYTGWRFFGLWGLILAPITAAAVKAAIST